MADFILKGPQKISPIIDKGIGEFFFEQAEKYADRVFQIDGDTGKRETFDDVKSRSIKLAIFLQNNGINSNDVVLLCCDSNLDNLIPVMAVQFLGAKVASVNSKQVLSDVKHCLTLVEPKAVFVVKESLEMIEKACRETDQKPFIITIGSTSGKYPDMLEIEKDYKEEPHYRPIKQKGSDVGLILFSSGTTSAPKGIYISNFMLLNIIAALSEMNHFKPGVLFHSASLYWISAWYVSLLCMYTGCSKVVTPQCPPEKFLDIIDKYKITYAFCAAPFTYQLTNLDAAIVKKYDTSSFFSMIIGGSTIDPNQILNIKKTLPHTHVNLGYGSTECCSIAVHTYGDSHVKFSTEKLESSGTLVPGLEMKIVDLHTEKNLGPNQKGEIRVKTPCKFSGYHKFSNPDLIDKDGFVKTGDIGYYDQDGYVYVTDRINDMFKCKANQVSPTILEKALLQHPAVAEAIAFGIPNNLDTHHPAASVLLKNGCNVNPEDLVKFAGADLADYYQLRGGVMIVDSIPKTTTGKYQRRAARDLFIKLKNQ